MASEVWKLLSKIEQNKSAPLKERYPPRPSPSTTSILASGSTMARMIILHDIESHAETILIYFYITVDYFYKMCLHHLIDICFYMWKLFDYLEWDKIFHILPFKSKKNFSSRKGCWERINVIKPEIVVFELWDSICVYTKYKRSFLLLLQIKLK